MNKKENNKTSVNEFDEIDEIDERLSAGWYEDSGQKKYVLNLFIR